MRDSRSYFLMTISCCFSNCSGFNSASLYNNVRSNTCYGLHHPAHPSLRNYASNNKSAEEEPLDKRKRSRSTKDNRKTTRRKNINTAATMNTAVCIIPPDDAWDSIQRARHLARDTTFYKWPPAIRLFHPFAPPQAIPTLVGGLAEWIEEEGTKSILEMELNGSGDSMEEKGNCGGSTTQPPFSSSSSTLLESFEVTLDSITILPHWEILQARIEALEERMPQRSLGESLAEKETRRKRAKGAALIEEEERKGLERKQERERKKRQRLKNKGQDTENDNQIEDEDDTTNGEDGKKGGSFNGPCVLYLSPNEESRIALDSLRETLREELFPMYDAFSPSSSVSPYPEYLPRKVVSDTKGGASTSNAIMFKPLLPIARFSSVDQAVKVAKVLQRTWDPLTFNVTDIQFVSRQDDNALHVNSYHSTSTSGVGFGNTGKTQSEDLEIPEVRHRKKHGTLSSEAANRMALTSSGEVEDVSDRGIYGCDAMVMLWGEEPEEELMDEEASLTMIMDDNDDELENSASDFDEDHTHELYYQAGDINYDEIFATAEREYQRMESYEEFSSVFDLEPGAQIAEGEEGGGIEDWLDDGDGSLDDEGATAVIGRAQFFMGAMRDFIGMPASSTIDGKDRIMGGGVSATARRRGAVHRLAESWSDGEYGRKDQDYLPK